MTQNSTATYSQWSKMINTGLTMISELPMISTCQNSATKKNLKRSWANLRFVEPTPCTLMWESTVSTAIYQRAIRHLTHHDGTICRIKWIIWVRSRTTHIWNSRAFVPPLQATRVATHQVYRFSLRLVTKHWDWWSHRMRLKLNQKANSLMMIEPRWSIYSTNKASSITAVGLAL